MTAGHAPRLAATAAAIPTNTHACPGCHRVQVPRHRLACRACWYRLPTNLRRPVTDNFRRNATEHLRAMQAALAWYRENSPAPPANPGGTCSAGNRPAAGGQGVLL